MIIKRLIEKLKSKRTKQNFDDSKNVLVSGKNFLTAKERKLIRLIDGKKNQEYTIKKINIEDKQIIKMLSNLGVFENEKIVIYSSNFFKTAFMVSVLGINFALDKSILKEIIVE